MEGQTFNCVMCNENVPLAQLVGHIPQCYRKFCSSMGILPLCTCDECEGKQAHVISKMLKPQPSTSTSTQPIALSAAAIASSQLASPVTPSLSQLRTSTSSLQSSSSTQPSSTSVSPVLETSVLTDFAFENDEASDGTEKDCLPAKKAVGRECLVCHQGKSPSARPFPIIHVGKYRNLLICKKQHLLNETEQSKVEDMIDKELQFVSTTHDKKRSVLLDVSEDDNEGNF